MTGRNLLAALLVLLAALLVAGLWWWSLGPADLGTGSGIATALPETAPPASGVTEAQPLPPAEVPVPAETPAKDGGAGAGEEPEDDGVVGPVTLEPEAMGRLKVTTEFGGDAKPGTLFFIVVPHAPEGVATILDGGFGETPIAAGTFTIRMIATGVTLAPHDSVVTITKGKTTALHIAIPQPKSLKLVLVGPDGEPARDVTVRLAMDFGRIAARGHLPGPGGGHRGMSSSFYGRSSRQRLTGWTMSETTAGWRVVPGPDGTVVLGDTGAYPVTVTVHLAGAVIHQEVIPPGTAERRIVLQPPPATLTVHVPDTAGLRGGCHLRIVQGERTRWHQRVTGAKHEFRNLGPGEYVVQMLGGSPSQYSLTRLTVTEAPQVLAMEPAPAAELIVRFIDNATDKPANGVGVSCMLEHHRIAASWDQVGGPDGGEYRLQLPAGEPLQLTFESKLHAAESRSLQPEPGATHDLGTIRLQPK